MSVKTATIKTADCESGGSVFRPRLLLPLASAELHLWLTYCDGISDGPLLATYRALLNAAEKEQESRFYFARDRHRYLLTRALVRTVLSRYVAVAPEDWVFSTNAYGRPHIVNVGAAADCGLSFNISHTEGLIVLGVAKGRSLGVDVENFAARNLSMEVANRYFAPQEVAALGSVLRHRRQYRLFESWTFKESYIKARGMGLSLPLDKFSFHYANDHAVDLTVHPELGDDSARWQFWQFQPTSEHLLAVCAEKIDGQSSRLTVRETIPMINEKVFTPEFLRISD
jgi:4'-phosphopantetheinyl transferase